MTENDIIIYLLVFVLSMNLVEEYRRQYEVYKKLQKRDKKQPLDS